MEALWSRGACSVREIQETFPARKRPAYTTVQTMVYRLEVKKVLRRVKKIATANIFEAAVSREAAERRLIDELLGLFGGRSRPIMAHLVDSGTLTLDDVRLSSRKGLVIVRMGKGNTYREVPLNAEVRTALDIWLEQRKQRVSQRNELALFLTKRGTRLATRSIDDVVRRLGQEANLSLSAHILRHTCLTSLVRHGNDLVLVAELAGHRWLETTRRYSLPTAADREAAMEGLKVEH